MACLQQIWECVKGADCSLPSQTWGFTVRMVTAMFQTVYWSAQQRSCYNKEPHSNTRRTGSQNPHHGCSSQSLFLARMPGWLAVLYVRGMEAIFLLISSLFPPQQLASPSLLYSQSWRGTELAHQCLCFPSLYHVEVSCTLSPWTPFLRVSVTTPSSHTKKLRLTWVSSFTCCCYRDGMC